MRAFREKACGLAVCLALLLPGSVLAAGGGEIGKLVIVADTRGLNGLLARLASLYNESHLYFTIFTVVAIPLVGLILGLLADVVMRLIGIDLKSRKLAEH